MPTHGLLSSYLPRWSTFAHSMFLYLLRAFDLISTFDRARSSDPDTDLKPSKRLKFIPFKKQEQS